MKLMHLPAGVTQYQTMLNFIPQAGGRSEITIESASITTSEGNTYELDPVTVTEIGDCPGYVPVGRYSDQWRKSAGL